MGAVNHFPTSRRPSAWIALVGVVLLAGCSGGDDAAAPGPSASSAAASPSASAEPTPTPAPPGAGSDAPSGDSGPEDSFLTWLAASRKPDAATACSYMTPALQQRMVDQMSATGLPIDDCASMIEFTAGLYAAAGQSSDTTVELLEQTDERAVLHVAYSRDGGSCGSVVLVPGAGHWILDERSEREC